MKGNRFRGEKLGEEPEQKSELKEKQMKEKFNKSVCLRSCNVSESVHGFLRVLIRLRVCVTGSVFFKCVHLCGD